MASSSPVLQCEAVERNYRLPVVREVAEVPWPAEVEFILSALDVGKATAPDRRVSDRTVYHVAAELTLFSDLRGAVPWTVYSRDVAARGMGFITRHRLPLGYGGTLSMKGPNGERLSIDCSIRRCRASVNGWFEGALSFNREQWALAATNFPAR